MPENLPRFADLNQIEEDLLVAKLRAARATISHPGEKGRSLEHVVATFLRSFLPNEYGLSTGFVVYHTPDGPRLSTQLDIIIYDAVRSSPLITLETCDVLPLEAVYGYVEVKATLTSSSDTASEFAENSIERCLQKNCELRRMKDRRYRVPSSESAVENRLYRHQWLSIRSFVFAFEPTGKTAQSHSDFAQRIADVSARLGTPTHLHGVFIANHGCFMTRPVDSKSARPEDYFHVNYTDTNPLMAFKTILLQGLAMFPRPQEEWAPALDQYLELGNSWQTKAPDLRVSPD